MRILSISGQNIASLAQPFSIDFTAAPLAGAGLFVITGETGAGKSSILDAMCLALYGDAPRLAGSAGDEVPDPSGKAIKARDSRAILRRGAAQGWAEVRFTARDGEDYIARWQARRARDKVDGQLQNVSRSLARVSDGQVLASQITMVTDQITALTGFSYDEFRRTVLLAQGDFDAFLRADTNDRASLLEKVTGTGLYRAVSSRIYERTEAARQAHGALVQRREGHQILTDEDRAALEAERLVITAANQAAGAEAKTLKDALARHTRHAETSRQVALAEAVLEQAVTRQADASVERAQLARIDQAAPLRAQWQTMRSARERVKDASASVSATTILSNEAAANANTLQETTRQAEVEHIAREDEFKVFGPLWDQAAALDSRINSATAELETSRSQAQVFEHEATEARVAFQALLQDEAKVRETLEAAQGKLVERSPDCALADHWPQTRQHIAEHIEAQSALSRAKTESAAHHAEVQRLTTALAELTTQTANDTAEEVRLAEEMANFADQLSAIEAAHPPGRGIELQTLATALADMRRAEQEHSSALSDLNAAEIAAKAAKEAMTIAGAEAGSAAETVTTANAQASALAAPAERANMAASDSARELRLRLEPGEPCPVCGSPEHPTHADTVLAKLAAGLRADLLAARATAEDARNKQADALRAQDRAKGELEQAGTNAQAAEAKIATALTHWQDAYNRAVSIPHCPALPAKLGEDPEKLDTLQTATTAAQQTEAAAQVELAGLRQTLATTTTRREDLRKIIAGHATARESLSSKLAAATSHKTLSIRAAEIAEAQTTRHATALSPILEELGETLSESGLSDRLESRVMKIAELRKARDGSSDTLAALAPRIAKAESRAESSAKHSETAKEAVTTRLKTLQSLQAERAPLLGGEATATHRTRNNDARKAASTALDTARTALTEATNAWAAARAKAETAADELSGAQQALETAQAVLADALADTDLVQDDLGILFALPGTEVTALRQRLRELDDAVTSARAALDSRRKDHTEAEAAGLPEESPEALTDALSVLDVANQTRAERIGAIDGELQRDIETRTALAGLEAEIAQARSELDVWEAVNHAAGSRNGDKFTRVAQSVTLDVLVDHANHHLADLNPRYRLRRAADLALQVEDRDMGGEARATRSLSGGERFLVSLALALALSRMGGKGGLAATLFIDEGFGSLDAGSLDLAIDALESLQSQGRQVGVISHVEAMKERIPTRIAVHKQGGGKSAIEVCAS